MNKKRLLLLLVISALIVSSGFGAAKALAANPDRAEQIQKMFGITLTSEQKNQLAAKDSEMEAERAAELAKWEAMDLATWKQQQIDKINATTQDEFDKIKEKQINMLKNGKGFGPGLEKRNGGMERPAE